MKYWGMLCVLWFAALGLTLANLTLPFWSSYLNPPPSEHEIVTIYKVNDVLTFDNGTHTWTSNYCREIAPDSFGCSEAGPKLKRGENVNYIKNPSTYCREVSCNNTECRWVDSFNGTKMKVCSTPMVMCIECREEPW